QQISTAIWGQQEGRSASLNAAWSPDSRRLAMAYPDNSIHVWDLSRDRVERVWRGHAEPIRSLAFTNDGKWLVSSSIDRTVRLWPQESSGLDVATNSLGMKLVPLPEGEFLMGTPRTHSPPGVDLSKE